MRIAVVGGGISGLTVAWYLRDHDVTIFEGSDRLGGKLRTVQLAGGPVDVGAEALLNRRPEAVQLAREVGLADSLTYPATTTAGLWLAGRHRPIPAGTVLGIPADLEALAAAEVLDDAELERVAADLHTGGEPLSGDVAIGRYATQRLGRPLVDRLVEPLLGGVYAGHADLLSLDATAPALMPSLRRDPSLIRAARAARAQAPTSEKPVFAGLVGGVGRLPEAVAAASGAKIRTGAMVRELVRGSATGSGRWRLIVGPTRSPEHVEVDAVVLACPARAASRLLAPVVPNELGSIEYASMATIVFAFRTDGALPGSGFLVPPGEGRAVKAATYSSVKWGWLADQNPGYAVLRCSVGRQGDEALLQRPDSELIRAALSDLREATGISDDPVDVVLTRWGGGLPQYGVGHRDLVTSTRAAVAEIEGLAVAGAAYDGVGVPACIASAKAAAEQVRRTVG